MNTVAAALISGGASVAVGLLTLVGVIISNSKTNRDVQTTLATAQAVNETKLDALTEEVRRHNNFAQRIPVMEEQIRIANHRIGKLEQTERRPPVC
ncbi:MAG: hypothetical protein MJ132_02155 [Clostridia bacterium]|nr:hypothetical protein [Clostridia bacterium]